MIPIEIVQNRDFVICVKYRVGAARYSAIVVININGGTKENPIEGPSEVKFLEYTDTRTIVGTKRASAEGLIQPRVIPDASASALRSVHDNDRANQAPAGVLARIPSGRLAEPDDFGGVLIFPVSKTLATLTGEILNVDGHIFGLYL